MLERVDVSPQLVKLPVKKKRLIENLGGFNIILFYYANNFDLQRLFIFLWNPHFFFTANQTVYSILCNNYNDP